MKGWRLFLPIAIVLIGSMFAVAARAAGPSLPPAPYKPVPVGAILDYGSWKCAVEASDGFDTVCADGGRRARLYGHFLIHGVADAQGYAGSVPAGTCNVSSPAVADLRLDRQGKRAMQRLWPLSVGKSAVATFLDGAIRTEFLVSHTERIRVGGADRNVYVVVGRGDYGEAAPCSRSIRPTAPARRGGRAQYRAMWWYDPDAGIVVKRRFDWLTGGYQGLSRQYQLVSAIFPLVPAAPPRATPQVVPVRTAAPPRPAPRRAAPQNAFRPLPVGTVLTYDSWRCTVETSRGYDMLCADGRRKARFFGHFVLHGVPDGRQFAGAVSQVECFIESYAGGGGLVMMQSLDLGDKDRQAIRGFWPLEVGKKIRFSVRHGSMASEKIVATLEVRGMETLNVAGKQRRVYRVRGTGEYPVCLDMPGPSEGSPRYEQTWWYDPAAGVIVKSRMRWTDGAEAGTGHAYELASVSFPEAAPPVAVATRRKPPPASVTTPPKPAVDNAPPAIDTAGTVEAKGPVVRVAGIVRDASRIIELTIDGRPVAMARDGSFTVTRGVPVGATTMRLAATDEWGNTGERSITVNRRRLARADPATTIARPARDTTPPVIEAPAVSRAAGGIVDIAGRVSDKSRVVELTLDGRPVPIAGDGSFRIKRGSARGTRQLRLTAIDEWGNKAERIIRVIHAQKANPYAGVQFGDYYALVIGNNDYALLPDLDTAVNDAEAVAALLEKDYAFNVKLLRNATRGDLLGALAKLRARLTIDDNLLIYYAGHGILDEAAREGYWLPVDAEEDVPTNWVSTNDITVMLRALRAKHVMVVADSCYSGTLVRAAPVRIKTARERVGWVVRMAKKRARTALVSGGLEPVLDSDGGEHSVFARAFLAALRENDDLIDGQGLFDAIKRPVVVNSDQTPQYSDIRRAGHDGGDFMFVRR